MARFRLRFLLQELDLAGPEVIIGRSPECQITIEDPLVSRQHARIRIAGNEARVSDLGSRNGVRINGNLIRSETVLKHNDRVRLGTQDLVFLVVEESNERLPRATGFMLHCNRCGRPYPGESAVCPHCGASMDDSTQPNVGYDTITGLVVEPKTSWAFQLLSEVIERALAADRAPEAERMMQRARQEIEERLAAGNKLDAKQLASVSAYAMRLAKLQGKPDWAEWGLAVHRQHDAMPTTEVLDALEALDAEAFDALRPTLSGFFLWWKASRAAEASEDERALSRRFAALVRSA